MIADGNEKWIGIEEAAEYLGVKPSTLRDWIKKKRIYQHGKSVSNGNLSALSSMPG